MCGIQYVCLCRDFGRYGMRPWFIAPLLRCLVHMRAADLQQHTYVLRVCLLSCFDAWLNASCCCTAEGGYEHLAFSVGSKAVLLALQQVTLPPLYMSVSRSGHTTDFSSTPPTCSVS